MNLPQSWGSGFFFAIPAILWIVGSFAVKRRPLAARVFAFVAGSDNRLSLSRIQAFAWTLVIFGSFAAAMAVHLPVNTGTPAEIEQQTAKAKVALQRADAVLTEADTKLEQKPTDAQVLLRAQQDEEKAKTARDAAQQALYAASSKWIEVPPELLSLAAIAIGSGVFSSLISAMGSEAKTACVTALESITVNDLKTKWPNSNAPSNASPLVIRGNDLGTSGRIRFGSVMTPILLWGSDGDHVVVDTSRVTRLTSLIVETSHGKLAYLLSGSVTAPVLERSTFIYDFADLFRDDTNPNTFSLMKFQMFGWTAIAILIYSWIFLNNLSPHLAALPSLDKTVVILTGLSQSGYLAGKAVSNANPSDAGNK